MNSTEITRTLDALIDRWCERRALKPLRHLLRIHPGPLFHTDQWFELLDALKNVKGLCRPDLTDEELEMVIEIHNAVEDSLKSH